MFVPPEYSKTRKSGVELMEHFCGKLSDVVCEQQIFELITICEAGPSGRAV